MTEQTEQTKTFSTKPLNRGPFARSPVTIFIPFHGQYQKVAALVESILRHTFSNPYEICLIDDASPNNIFITDMAKVPQVVTHRTPSHVGFGGALQYGFDRTKQPWCLFMHSDCVVEDMNWMIKLGECLLKNKSKGVKLVSARTNNPGPGTDSRLKADAKTTSEDAIIGPNDFVPLYCAMCHRDLFRHIRGFIKAYPYAYYEDEELAYRMNKMKFKQAVCGTSWVRHEGGGTINELAKNPEIKAAIEANREKCIADMKNFK